MLKQLSVNHVILVETTKIDFCPTLNVLTGETGSGKSAVIAALQLILGERASIDVIRQGHSQAVVEALFDIDAIPSVLAILEEGGIQHDIGEDLIIRREVQASGKSRAFINHQMAQLSLLQKVGKALVDSVGQHANQRLQSIDYHRQTLDIFGGLEEEAAAFKKALTVEESVREQLEACVGSEATRLREIERCQNEIEEISSAYLKEGEEDELFAEYTLLVNSEELSSIVQALTEVLSGEDRAVMEMLRKSVPLCERLVALNPGMGEVPQCIKTVLLELQELHRTLHHYAGKIDFNPHRLEEINSRLSLINLLKRKYGKNVADIQAYLAQSRATLHQLENIDVKIEGLQKELAQASERTITLARALTQARTGAAREFEEGIIGFLHKLNMPAATFSVQVSPQKRSHSGDDKIEFYLAPNVGEKAIPLKSCASGGELSRVMLSIKAMLAGKECIPILIFDEIDANIGGETAAVIGETLAEISRKHQVICITHFPQVARQAAQHIKIAKQEMGGRTVTVASLLDIADREEELTRMLGGEKFALTRDNNG